MTSTESHVVGDKNILTGMPNAKFSYKVKVSHSLIAVEAVEVRVPLYLGNVPIHCWVDKFSTESSPSLELAATFCTITEPL